MLRWQSWPLLRTDHRAVAFTEVLKGASGLDLMVTRVLSWRREVELILKIIAVIENGTGGRVAT